MILPQKYPTWASSFQFRDFQLLAGSTVFISMAQGMEMVALGWLIFDITNSPFLVGTAYAANMAPLLILGIVSGAISDWLDRRLLYRFIIFGGVVVAGAMALILVIGGAQVWQIILLSVVSGVVFALNQSISPAYTYDIVGPLHALNGLSLVMIGKRIGMLCGSLLSGFIISAFGPAIQYAAISVAYAIALAVLIGTKAVGQVAPTRRGSMLQNLVGYLELIRDNSTLLSLMLLTIAIESLGWSYDSLLPVFAKDVLHVGAVGLGSMHAMGNVGGIIGLGFLAGIATYKHKGLLLFLSTAAFGLSLMAISLMTNLISFLLVIGVVNGIASISDALFGTLMQNSVSNEQRGRAMGSYVFSMGVSPLGILEISWVAGLLGARIAIFINGGILALVSIISTFGLTSVRRLQ